MSKIVERSSTVMKSVKSREQTEHDGDEQKEKERRRRKLVRARTEDLK